MRRQLAQTLDRFGVTAALAAATVAGYLIWLIDWGHMGTRHWKAGLISMLVVAAFVFFGIAWLSHVWASAIDRSRPPFTDPNR